ncbi:hypothetical protein PACILC2_03750 [Paenibacillus cisolokensis]|uniref:Bacterial transcriptional activator domain-containing protein n=1 Tax=Paenibacillus cisolokensis TaxID=1658519 RepID=A0ABQ4N0Y6_9BACL|nr:DUF6483 family protein [Paenibacillus cisolokensis]GIQ61807.1 hypothetical protein PACILC2_03750 [Paenibacillus cisolokensis]
MLQRDYLMRMIEQVASAIGQVMGLRRQMRHQEALLVIDELLDSRFRLNGRLIRSLSDEDIVGMMTTNGVMETENIQAIALLLKQESEIYEEMGDGARAYPLQLKALQLFARLAAADAPKVLADSDAEAERLLLKLSDCELPAATKRLVMDWQESRGRYDQAENWLYELLVEGEAGRDEAVAFYRRLLPLPDERLAAGGLPREEVEEGLAQAEADAWLSSRE